MLLGACGRVDFDPLARVDDGAPLAYREAVLADRPIAYWRLDDPDATARDELGAHSGTYSGDCLHVVSGALVSDPSPAVHFGDLICRVDAPAIDFDGLAPYTVELWASLDTVTDYHSLFMNETRSGFGPGDGYALFFSQPFGGVYFERAHLAANYATTNFFPTAGVMTYYAGVYDGTQLQLYVDGQPFGNPVMDTRPVDATGAAAVIGSLPAGAQGDAHTPGVIDEVAIYDHVVPPERLALHHDIGRNGPH